jgi:adenylosuccinate lyase
MENVALWNERDISHSSVERYIGPDATVALDFSLRRLNGLIKNLVVYPKNMERNLNQMRGLIFSQKILLDLTQAGVSREDSYRMVQRNAMKVWDEGKDFQEELLADTAVVEALGEEKIRESFDLDYHLKHVDTIFKRVFGE